MTKIDIFSGFLGAGKTTLIKKLINEAYVGEKVVLIENEFGEIGIDGGFLKDSGIEITEMNSGCICCSLVGDFTQALAKVLEQFSPDRVIIEPSGVGKLSDVVRAVEAVVCDNVVINCKTAVVDAAKCKMYMKNFGEFFGDQIESASAIVLSHTDTAKQHKIEEAVALVREHNEGAVIITTPISALDGKELLFAIENENTLKAELEELEKAAHEHCCCGHHHHEEHEHDEHCCCGHHHHEEHEHDEHCGCGHHHHEEHEHDEHCCCGHHHHEEHEHDEHCCCGHHHHEEHEHDEHCGCGHHHHEEHEHDEHCGCGHHHHEEHEHDEHCGCGHHHHEEHEHDEHCGCGHHHHHHADEVFTSVGIETAKKFTSCELNQILEKFDEDSEYGMVLRAKGIVASEDGKWLHFDYVPLESDVREGSAGLIGRICVIGTKLDESKIKELFGV